MTQTSMLCAHCGGPISLVRLALQEDGEYMTARDIEEITGLTIDYIRKALHSLAKKQQVDVTELGHGFPRKTKAYKWIFDTDEWALPALREGSMR